MHDELLHKQTLDRIRENIARHGHHIYIVSGGAIPRYAYTIGLSEHVGIELILAGAVLYMKDDVLKIINDISSQLKNQRQRMLQVVDQGTFSLSESHSSWTSGLMQGAADYYQVREIPALQINPDEPHWTVDVPDMSTPWSAHGAPVWRWLYEPWTYPVPQNATATTDLAALRGERITEAMRWEEDEWEIFAGDGPTIPKDQLRVVPLGTLLGADDSLAPVVKLAIGEGVLRDPDTTSDWRPWRKQAG